MSAQKLDADGQAGELPSAQDDRRTSRCFGTSHRPTGSASRFTLSCIQFQHSPRRLRVPLVGRIEADTRGAAQLVARQVLLPRQAAMLANARRRGDPRPAHRSRGRTRQADFCAAAACEVLPAVAEFGRQQGRGPGLQESGLTQLGRQPAWRRQRRERRRHRLLAAPAPAHWQRIADGQRDDPAVGRIGRARAQFALLARPAVPRAHPVRGVAAMLGLRNAIEQRGVTGRAVQRAVVAPARMLADHLLPPQPGQHRLDAFAFARLGQRRLVDGLGW